MASNQSKVAETKPPGTDSEAKTTSEQSRICPAPSNVPENIPSPLISAEGGGKPDLDTGQNSSKDIYHPVSNTEPKLHIIESTLQGIQPSDASHPVATILSDIVESVASEKSEATSQHLDTTPTGPTQMETQDVNNVTEVKSQEVDTKPAEMKTAPTAPELEDTQDIPSKSVETETKDTATSSRMETQDTPTETQEVTVTSSEMEIQENVPKLTEVETQEKIPKLTETQEKIPKLREVETQENIPKLTEMETQENIPKLTEMETQDNIPKLTEMETQDNIPKLREMETQENIPKLTEVETQEKIPKLTEVVTQEKIPKLTEVVTQEKVPKLTEVETQEDVSKSTRVTSEELVDTHLIPPDQGLVPKPVPMETQEPVQNPKLVDDKESLLKPFEITQETDKNTVKLPQEIVQIHVEMTEPDKKPVETTIETIQKPVEMAQETDKNQVEITSQEPSQKSEEIKLEKTEIKPAEMLAQAPDMKLVESTPEMDPEPTTQALAQTQTLAESKGLSPMSEEGLVLVKTGEDIPVQLSALSTEIIPVTIDTEKEPVMITSQVPSVVMITAQESPLVPEVVMTSSNSLPESKPDDSSANDVIIVEDERESTELTQPEGYIIPSQEVRVITSQTHEPSQLNKVDLPTPDAKGELLSPELMQVDPAPLLPPIGTELMDISHGLSTLPPNVPIDTIVISDSPVSTVSYSTQSADQMDVIVLSSPESSPLSPYASTTPPSKRSKVSLSDIVSPPSPPKPTGSKSKLSADLEMLEMLINSCEMLVGLTVQDQNVCFSYQHKGVCNNYTLICIEGDYPQVSLLVSSKDGNDSDILSKRLPCIAWDLLLQCCAKEGVCPPSTDTLPPELRGLLLPAFHSQISSQSNTSQATNGTDEDLAYTDDSSNEDDPYDFDEPDEVTMHPLLIEDVERVKQKFNPNAIVTRNYGGIGDIDIDLIIDMNFLEPEIARAWGVKHTVPLTVRLSLSADHYLDGGDIKTEVFQEERTNTKGICKQMEKIISNFISSSVKAANNPLCNSKVEEAMEAHRDMEQRLAEKRRVRSKLGCGEKKGMLAQFVGKFSREKQVDYDMRAAQLVEMGWDMELAVHALQECNMDLEKALDYLSDDRTEELDEDLNPKSFTKQQSRGAEVSGLDWMSDLSDSNQAAIKSKAAPPLSHGFLCHVIQYILNRIPTLNDFCVICDETHLFSNGAMLKPTVCARELCSFAFQTLGVMADVADSIATGPEVVELLVAMCNAASLSGRREDILDPYPTVVDPSNPKQFALHPKEKDFKKVEAAMKFVIQELKSLPAVLKERLDSLNTSSFPLLQWVLASNRCHIVKLPPDRQIKSMGTTHQFLLLSAPPAKEASFRKLKQKHKSTYAFHGSRLENWHSIMRNGLLNASGTKFQLNGAAYGSGIYLSPHASVSFGYSGIHGGAGVAPVAGQKKGRPTMLSSQNLNCIALCEVIDIKIKKSGNIWVLPESDHVVTRFFFVYEDNTTGDTNFDTRQDKYIKEIENAVKSLL